MRLVLQQLWVDSDGMLQVDGSVKDAGYSAKQDFYVYPDQLKEFGKKLQAFPTNVSDEVALELGSTGENADCWVRFLAYVCDQRGHCALEFSVKRNGARHVQATSNFYCGNRGCIVKRIRAPDRELGRK